MVPLLIKVLHLLLLDVGPAHLVPRLEGGLQHAAREEIADARAHKSGSLARLHVLELDDLERIAVVEDLEPVAKFAGVVDLCQVTPPREPAMYRKPAGP